MLAGKINPFEKALPVIRLTEDVTEYKNYQQNHAVEQSLVAQAVPYGAYFFSVFKPLVILRMTFLQLI